MSLTDIKVVPDQNKYFSMNGKVNIKDSFQMDLGRRLLNEAKNGNAEQIKNLVALGAPFTADWLGTSPLHYAAYHNFIEVTAILLKFGIVQDARNKVDRTPLHIACQMGHIEIVKLLFSFNADATVRDMLKMTPLHWAAEGGNADIVELILHHGCPVDTPDKFGKTAKEIAEDKEDYRTVRVIEDFKKLSTIDRANAISKSRRESSAYGRRVRAVDPNDILMIISKKKKVDVVFDEPFKNGKHKFIGDDTFTNGDEFTNLESVTVKQERLSPPPENFAANTLHILEEHGISMLEPDNGTVVSSAVECGQSVKLTEAGKLALSSSKPGKMIHVPKPKTIIQIPKPSTAIAKITKPNGIPLNILGNGKKIIQVKADELIKMTSQKKFIIKQARPSPIARLLDVHPGREARVATVKTATGTLTRPVQRLCPREVTSTEGCDMKGLHIKDEQKAGNPGVTRKCAEVKNQDSEVPTKTRRGRIIKLPAKYIV